MWLVGSVAVAIIGGVIARRFIAWNRIRKIARAGFGARVELCGRDALNPRQVELLTQMERLGFVAEPSGRVVLGEWPPSVVAAARDASGTLWFRASAIDGHDMTTSSLTSLFPGGAVVTSTAASSSVDPREVLQCLPDAAPGRLLRLHQDALDAVAAAGVEPVMLPADLLVALHDEWVEEARAFFDAGLLGQLAASRGAFESRETMPIADRPDLGDVAARLGTRGPV